VAAGEMYHRYLSRTAANGLLSEVSRGSYAVLPSHQLHAPPSTCGGLSSLRFRPAYQRPLTNS